MMALGDDGVLDMPAKDAAVLPSPAVEDSPPAIVSDDDEEEEVTGDAVPLNHDGGSVAESDSDWEEDKNVTNDSNDDNWLAIFSKSAPEEDEEVVSEDDVPDDEAAASDPVVVQEDVPTDVEMVEQDDEAPAAEQEDVPPEPSSDESTEPAVVKDEDTPDAEMAEQEAAAVEQEDVPEPSSKEYEAVEDDTSDVKMTEQEAAAPVQNDVPEPSSNESEMVAEDALDRIKEIDMQKVAKRQANADKAKTSSTDSPSDKDFFEPSEAQAAKLKMKESRTSKEAELEALRNRGLTGRKSRQLKKTINQNIKNQIADGQHDMEFKKVAKGDDGQEDHIEIGTMTTSSTIAAPPQLLPSPAHRVTSPSSGYEQLALEQQKERLRAREMEKEIMLQNQLHPESQQRKSMLDKKLLLELDFVFGLVVGEQDKAPDMRTATKAASKIVPNMLTSKKTIYYDPRYPPKVASIVSDESYTEDNKKRYMVLGKVPVLPRNRKRKSSSVQIPKSPKSTSATVSTLPLTPLTVATVGSASNSVCSNETPAASVKKDAEASLALPSMEPSGGNVANTEPETATTKQLEEEPVHEEEEEEGVLEGPMNTSTEDFASPIRPSKKSEVDTRSSSTDIQSIRMSKDAELEAIRQISPVGQKPKLEAIDPRLSSTKQFESLRMSKDAELEAIRQRGVAKQKNLGFSQLEAQSALAQAAYQAEQQDLQKRKSASKEFQFEAGKIVNPHDMLYRQQNKQNRSYREIQQKTLDEYHRKTPSSGGGDDVNNEENNEEGENVTSPSDEEETTTNSGTANNNKTTDPVLSEPPSLSAKDQASRQSRYNKLFQKIRPRSKKSLEIEENSEETSSHEKNTTETAMSNAVKEEESSDAELDVKSSELKLEELRKAKQEELKALHQKESIDPELDVKSSELKFEQIRKAKQEELKKLRERGLQHKTSDGKIRMSREGSDTEQASTSPALQGGTDGLKVGFGMFVKGSSARHSGSNLNLNPPGVDGTNATKSSSPTGQEWRAVDDASPSRIKHTSLKNKEAQELARLRQQGLAKQGSQRYAIFEKTSRESQLEYEAAAQDLARRKSQTSEYTYNGTKEISPVDAVYLDHQQWRKDIVKEEKEALGLFDEAPEHVDQDDVEGQIPVSNAKFTNTTGYQKWETGDRPVGDKKKEKKKFGVGSNCGVSSHCGCTIM